MNKIIYTFRIYFLTLILILGLVGCSKNPAEEELPSSIVDKAPTAITVPAKNLKFLTATLYGSVQANNIATTAYFEYGTNTSYGIKIDAKENPFTGVDLRSSLISADIKGLSKGTIYHFRVVAKNSGGISYGNDRVFSTLLDSVSDICGNKYYTVKIGTQIWMSEDLKTTKLNDGTSLNVSNRYLWNKEQIPACCHQDEDHYYRFGLLYNYYCVQTGKLCPTGWHVSSEAEWGILKKYLGESEPAHKIRSFEGWESAGNNTTNESGFSAMGGGMMYSGYNQFRDFKKKGYWWVSDPYVGIILNEGNGEIGRNSFSPSDGLSVRCIRD